MPSNSDPPWWVTRDTLPCIGTGAATRLAPYAHPMPWCPRQIPSTGTSASAISCGQVPKSVWRRGVPGPGEMMTAAIRPSRSMPCQRRSELSRTMGGAPVRRSTSCTRLNVNESLLSTISTRTGGELVLQSTEVPERPAQLPSTIPCAGARRRNPHRSGWKQRKRRVAPIERGRLAGHRVGGSHSVTRARRPFSGSTAVYNRAWSVRGYSRSC